MRNQSTDHIKEVPDAVVGVLSDTHDTLSESCYAALADCDLIIHAGDIGDPSILTELRTLAPVVAVLGNNDYQEYGANVRGVAKLELAGVRFFIAHYPEKVDLRKRGAEYFKVGELLPHVCIHGHTHVPRIVTGKEASPADLILCPGSPSYPRKGSKPSIAKIALAHKSVQDVWFEDVYVYR